MTTRTVKFLGTTDDVTTCECCGKTNLKGTVAISVDGGEALHFGTTCAARALALKVAEVKAGTKAADDAKAAAERAARQAAADKRAAEWFAFLNRNAPGVVAFDGRPDVAGQIAKLGGFKVARDLFAAQGGER